MAKHNTHEAAAEAPAQPAPATTVAMTVGPMTVNLPISYVEGHVCSARDAAALDAFKRSRFISNIRSDIERGGKTYTAAEIEAKYAAYELGAMRDPAAAGEAVRTAAARRALVELFDEHNASVAAGGVGHFGSVPKMLPAGKGSKDAIDAMVTRILASGKHEDRISRHVAAIRAERGAKKPATEGVAVATAADLDAL